MIMYNYIFSTGKGGGNYLSHYLQNITLETIRKYFLISVPYDQKML